MLKEKLYGKTLNELIAVTKHVGLPGFAAKQIADWLYKKEIGTINEMTNLSKKMRELLSNAYEIGLSDPVSFSESKDGTKKYLYKVLNDKYVETAFIPDEDRATICVSSQSGCKMGCIFCMTGKQGFQGNLSSNEILNQFRSLPEFKQLTNMVYMGMGEPLDNMTELLKSLDIMTGEWGYGWSPTRITVSTVGMVDGMKEFLEKSRCHLAVSLHSPFDEERRKLMPIQRTNNVKEILDIIRNFDFNSQRRVSFEYILFDGLNDSPRHIKELTRILNGIKCRINIIRFHPVPGSTLRSPDHNSVIAFKEALNTKGILTTIRASRGDRYTGCLRSLINTRTKQRLILMFRRLAFLLFLYFPQLMAGQAKALQILLADSSMKHSSVSLCILNSGSGETVYEFNALESQIPASVMKLVTTAAALELLGPEYRFHTRIGYTGSLNKNTGLLNGDIVITGGGDPSLGSEYFKEHYHDFLKNWITEIMNLGIKSVDGRVLTDDSRYDYQPVPAKWLWEDAGNYYGAGAYGLSVFDNTFRNSFTDLF